MYKSAFRTNRPKFIAAILFIVFCSAVYLLTVRSTQAQAPPAPGSSLDQRIAQRKAERKIAIAPKDQQRIVSVCVAAQTKVRSLQQKTTPAVAKRAQVNRQIDAKLWIMVGKLKIAEKDSFQLEKQRALLADKVSAYQAISQNYSQTLDDVVAINCRNDAVGFKALLVTAQLYRAQVRNQSGDIRNYINNDIKSSLSAYATDLQVKPSTEEGR